MKIRPFLKWAGNKYRCLDAILTSLPEASRLIEPFAGSAAVFLNANYHEYLLAEENNDLIALYTHLQQEGASFIHYCKRLFTPQNNEERQYYLLREEFNTCRDSRKRAALFLYLNRHGYNGLCRYNLQGIYNVPFGRYTKPYFPLFEMEYFFNKSQQATFMHRDFRETFKLAKPGDIVYCDPPYAPLNQDSNFTGYIGKQFGEKEQIMLAKLAEESAKLGITVIISNHDTDFTRHHYRHGEIKSFPVKRSISCKSNRRINVNELVAIFR
ncbi:Dam family site-specific DNA-(adenine-N6)-methyltransferase [Legionella impletisoli]|uniref:Site-specific DNA-methyltransferase (adenine-specific) n=1 Tax=Legionella impletisoli TaxID=343510 RepID=A0A917NE48_9GAMM|nr:Dam family site-specific DNA-(adenine-N6)-methyltransferase [Legionella impletisoli]GGI91892.1 site-specific DNA-methyltransferase (adenine-specific) [Legionella impletisoli]